MYIEISEMCLKIISPLLKKNISRYILILNYCPALGQQSGNFNENRVGVKKFEQTYPSKSENSGRVKSDRDLVCNYCFNLGHWKNKCPDLAAK